MGTVINPNGKSWFATASGVTVIGTTKTYQTYADLLREQYPGKLAWVVDASGDPSVDKGLLFMHGVPSVRHGRRSMRQR